MYSHMGQKNHPKNRSKIFRCLKRYLEFEEPLLIITSKTDGLFEARIIFV